MAKVLVIGAGGVGTVVAHKMAQLPEIFSEVLIASRTYSKVEKILKKINKPHFYGATVDADRTEEVVSLIEDFKPEIVVNVALPYQDLPIMDACLQTQVSYLDTANYEPKDLATYGYKWQWAYKDKFKEAGIMAILGCGFDPGVTQAFVAYAHKHYFDEIHYLDIVDCNAGDHGKYFATNFNPEINIREVTQNGRYYENGQWIETKPQELKKIIEYPGIGPKDSYLMYHEELESLVKNFPTLKRARFWMTFSQRYLTALEVLQEVGMTSIKPINFNGIDIVPLEFLKAVLPEPSELGSNYKGQTSIGVQLKGIKDGKERTCYIWNNCSHEEAYKETGTQAINYTTGVPAMIGAKLYIQGIWKKPGVYNVEELDPDPFMEDLNKYGLPWNIELDKPLPIDLAK
ncbi:MAG: saccharopine dehydrogenase family protein [Bacteroidales bacterium]|nr:saccharopine dehydrogenase family protein [Bacteroidales bacterium]